MTWLKNIFRFPDTTPTDDEPAPEENASEDPDKGSGVVKPPGETGSYTVDELLDKRKAS